MPKKGETEDPARSTRIDEPVDGGFRTDDVRYSLYLALPPRNVITTRVAEVTR